MMKNKKDPKWISQADRIYGGFLYLFPSAHRKEFGPWMRQAFRDRCREVARGEQSLFRVIAAEAVPDLIVGFGREHMTSNFGELNRKHFAALTLLGCMSLWALFHDPINRQIFDLVDAAQRKASAINDGHQYKKYESNIQEMASWLATEEGSPKAKALAAYLNLETDSKKSAALVDQVITEHPDVRTLAIAELACSQEAHCKRSMLVKNLTDQSPANAYVWLRALNLAVTDKDKIGERYAIKKIAESSYLESYERGVENELLAYAEKYSPKDTELLKFLDARSASYTPIPSIYTISKSMCGTVSVETADLDLLSDCRKISTIFGQEDDLATAAVVGKLRYKLAATQLDREKAILDIRNYKWWQQAYYNVPDRNSRESWEKWYADWRGKRESIPAIQSILKARGMPSQAPDDFLLTEYDRNLFGIKWAAN